MLNVILLAVLKLALTFDDGFVNHLTEVAPLLEKYQMPGAFSVITDVVDAPPPTRMNWNEVRKLHTRGFEIFSHSSSHPNLPRLARAHEAEKVRYEITNSYARIAAEVGAPPKVFCLPFNATNSAVNQMIREAGMIPMQAKRVNFGDGTFSGGKADINAHIDKLLAEGKTADALMIHGIKMEGDKGIVPLRTPSTSRNS